MLMVLLALVMLVGREAPQAFSIRVVPSPSMIARWSLQFAVWNAVNCNLITLPGSTCIVVGFARPLG